VHLIGKPQLQWDAVNNYLHDIGGEAWFDRIEPLYQAGDITDAEAMVEFAGRLCYRAWAPGLNANVTKVREDSGVYLRNILQQRHGSVLEHAYWIFIFQDVSRVWTHEWVRHRMGVSISQESLRYVRLDKLKMWIPPWAQQDLEFFNRAVALVEDMEAFQVWMAEHFNLDREGMPFDEKKAKTSFMRRFAPEGLATSMVWGGNTRAVRHVLEMRSDTAAEEEMRLVTAQLGHIMQDEAPKLFGDYVVEDNHFKTEFRKV